MARPNIPLSVLAGLSLSLLLAACGGGAASTGPDTLADPDSRIDDRDPREVERNREAMLELMERGDEVRRAQPEIAGELPADLRVDVLDGEGQVVDPGAEDAAPMPAERSALDTVIEAGPAALLATVELEPVQGSRSGFRVLAMHAGAEPLFNAGIRVGDVVRRVNGHDVLMPDGFMAAWESLGEADEIVIDLDRGSEAHTFTIPVATPAP